MNKRRSFIVLTVIAFVYIFSFASMVSAQMQVGNKGIFAGASQPSAKKDMLDLARDQATAYQEKLIINEEQRQKKLVHKKAIETIFVLFVGYLLLFLLIRIINNRVTNIKARHIVRKNTVYVITLIICILIFFIWVQNLNSLTIFLGVASAGLALALQEVILCGAGWVLILMRRPFEVGDRIEINGIKGDIIDIRVFQTSVLEIGNWVDADQSTGRIVNIPNSFVFKHSNYNYSRGFEFIWNEIPILITFESDWKRAKEIMTARANKLAEGMENTVRRKIDAMRNRYMIFYGSLTPIVYVNIKDSGVELTLRYLTESKKRRSTQDQLCREILEDFGKESNVNLAYPTYRIVKS